MAPQALARAVFLDVGGTLLTEEPSRFALYSRAAHERGLQVDPERMRILMRAAHAALPREIGPHFRYSEGWFGAFIEQVFVAGLGLERAELPGLRRELFERFAAPATYRTFEGALELVRALKERGVVVGVVSNWSERLPGILDGLGLARWLDFTLASAVVRHEKPERAMFELALERAGVPARAAIHAGNDLELDVQGAGALGILPVLVDRERAHLDTTCARVGDLIELRRWITARLEAT